MKRFLFSVRVSPGDTAKASGILKGQEGVNTIAAFIGWYHSVANDSGTEFVRRFVIESSYPATGTLSVSVTVDGVLASPMYTTDAEAAQSMVMLASLMQGALNRAGVAGTVSYASQDYNANYSTMTPISDAIGRIPQTIADAADTAKTTALEVLQFLGQGATQALIVTAVGIVLFMTVVKAVTE